MPPIPLTEPTEEQGIVLLQGGFRLFFPLAALYALIGIGLWIFLLTGTLTLPLAFQPLDWHIHEMLYGFIGAAVAGFLLTAVPNWTGMAPMAGWRLGLLGGLWLLGRLAVTLGGDLDWMIVAAADVAFPTLLVLMIARDVVRADNSRNYILLVILALFPVGALLFHLEGGNHMEMGQQIGLYSIVFLLSIVGGRVVPNFTGNWLARYGGPNVRAFGTIDILALGTTFLGAIHDIALAEHPLGHWLLVFAGFLHLLRLSGWQGWRALSEPIVWVLHLGYLWLAVGLVFLGLSGVFEDVPRAGAMHALTAGAMATMIIAIMSRAILGHSGREIRAARFTVFAYILLTVGTILRIVAAWVPGLLHASAGIWMLAFVLFLVVYLPVVTQPRAR
ncbi:NnrS family protein [Magnetospira sp. QH-2]|uniref:NnrS family protein n=1 Tax=Magnetospira sp. (strain QH-2) TaxID=1288970 RepID=UPI0003E80BFD|nr:NnrS family protein [Magnetospira sp. QH-2]CCQ74377.1 Putative NnrS family protein [Magnetospira sp. QH-2]